MNKKVKVEDLLRSKPTLDFEQERATTPEKKKEFLHRLETIWMNNPSLRFGQLLENVYHHLREDHCFYYTEDEPFLQRVEAFYHEEVKK